MDAVARGRCGPARVSVTTVGPHAWGASRHCRGIHIDFCQWWQARIVRGCQRGYVFFSLRAALHWRARSSRQPLVLQSVWALAARCSILQALCRPPSAMTAAGAAAAVAAGGASALLQAAKKKCAMASAACVWRCTRRDFDIDYKASEAEDPDVVKFSNEVAGAWSSLEPAGAWSFSLGHFPSAFFPPGGAHPPCQPSPAGCHGVGVLGD